MLVRIAAASFAAWLITSSGGARDPAPAAWQTMGAALRPTLQPHPPAPTATPANEAILPRPAPATADPPAGKRTNPNRTNAAAPPRQPVDPPAPKPAAEWPPPPPAAGKAASGKPRPSWSADEIKAAKAICKTLLADVVAVAVPEDAFREGASGGCGDAAPVRVMSIGKSPQVVLSPPALVSCQMLAGLHRWLAKDLQPLARKHLKSQIVQIDVMSDYSCRGAYGRRGARLSEHARANALDIGVLRLADQSVLSVLTHWGPTQRDILAAKAAAEKEARAAKAKPASTPPTAPATSTPAAQPTTPAGPAARNVPVGLAPPQRLAPPLRLGGPKSETANPRQAVSEPSGRSTRTGFRTLAVPDAARSRFLREAHVRGCKVFGTILGPEANEAHRNHFHIDMAQRKHANFCE